MIFWQEKTHECEEGIEVGEGGLEAVTERAQLRAVVLFYQHQHVFCHVVTGRPQLIDGVSNQRVATAAHC